MEFVRLFPRLATTTTHHPIAFLTTLPAPPDPHLYLYPTFLSPYPMPHTPPSHTPQPCHAVCHPLGFLVPFPTPPRWSLAAFPPAPADGFLLPVASPWIPSLCTLSQVILPREEDAPPSLPAVPDGGMPALGKGGPDGGGVCQEDSPAWEITLPAFPTFLLIQDIPFCQPVHSYLPFLSCLDGCAFPQSPTALHSRIPID